MDNVVTALETMAVNQAIEQGFNRVFMIEEHGANSYRFRLDDCGPMEPYKVIKVENYIT